MYSAHKDKYFFDRKLKMWIPYACIWNKGGVIQVLDYEEMKVTLRFGGVRDCTGADSRPLRME